MHTQTLKVNESFTAYITIAALILGFQFWWNIIEIYDEITAILNHIMIITLKTTYNVAGKPSFESLYFWIESFRQISTAQVKSN